MGDLACIHPNAGVQETHPVVFEIYDNFYGIWAGKAQKGGIFNCVDGILKCFRWSIEGSVITL